MITSKDISPYLAIGKTDKLVSFYNSNIPSLLPLEKDCTRYFTILTYNVHGWININDNISVKDNYINNIDLIELTNADVVILQEVCFEIIRYKKFRDDMESIGYNYVSRTKNGGCFHNSHKTDYIVFVSKYPIIFDIIIDISINNDIFIDNGDVSNKNKDNDTNNINKDDKNQADINDINKDDKNKNNDSNGNKSEFPVRKAIIAYVNDITFALVHLEIGNRYYHLPVDDHNREIIITSNIHGRIAQLEEILKHCPDVIVGDFNFTPTDYETKWLKRKHYKLIADPNINTTPYNRTDMLFQNSLKFNVKCTEQIISANFSDHLPVKYYF